VGEGEKNPDDQVLELVEFLKDKYPVPIMKEGERKPTINNFSDSLEIC